MNKPLKVTEKVYQVGSADLTDPYDCCIYLVEGEQLLLIDAGAGRSYDRIVQNVGYLNLNTSKIENVLATHAHIDHIGALHKFREKLGVRILAHELDADAIEKGYGTAAEVYGMRYTPCTVDVRLAGRETSLDIGGLQVHVMHMPGHTPGSVAAYVDTGGRRVLFGQDIHGPYYREWGAEPELAKQSLLRLAELRADILCEGHFGVIKSASEVEAYIRGYAEAL